MKEELIASAQVFNRDSHNAVEVLIDLLDAGPKLLPQDLRFDSGWSRALRKAHGQEEAATE
jgi:hypothetical protein